MAPQPTSSLSAEDVWAVAVTTAQTGPPALAVIARHYLDTHPPPTTDTRLTEREEQVVRLIARGYSNKEIAAKMGISVKTAETFKARAKKKLGVNSHAALVRYAARQGWLNPVAADWV